MAHIEIDNLLTIRNYAAKYNCTTAYIYKLIKAGKITPVVIDGVQFIDTTLYAGAVRL